MLAWTAFSAACAGALGAVGRFLYPNVLFEPAQRFKVGFPAEFAVGQVDERFTDQKVWIVRTPEGFYALSTICTHLGCTPQWLAAQQRFKCPCHGSGLLVSGIHIEGPAPRPLERFRISLAGDGQIEIDKNTKYLEEKGQWSQEGAFLPYE